MFQLFHSCGYLEFTCVSDCFWTNKTLEQGEILWYMAPHWQFATTKDWARWGWACKVLDIKNVFYLARQRSKSHSQSPSVAVTSTSSYPLCKRAFSTETNAGSTSSTGSRSGRSRSMNSTDSSIPLRAENFKSVVALIFASRSTNKEPDPRSTITQAVLFTVNELLPNSVSPSQP